MSQCIRNTIVKSIIGNATSYKINADKTEIFVSANKFGAKSAYKIAEKMRDKANQLFNPQLFGRSVSLNTTYTDGTAVNIHPTQALIDLYEVKDNTKNLDEIVTKFNLSNKESNQYFSRGEVFPTQEDADNYFQLTPKRINTADKILDSFLEDYLKLFGVKMVEITNFKEQFGVDAVGVTDVIQKLIYLASKRDITTMPEEAAHMVVMLMGKSHPLIKKALDGIENWEKFESINNQYSKLYNNPEKVKIEALGKLISEAIIKQYIPTTEKEKTLFDKIKKLVKAFFDNFRIQAKISENIGYSKGAVEKIAEAILKNDLNLINSQKGYIYPILDYKKALENDPISKNIINQYTKELPFKITGSLAIAKQTNINRWSKEPLHDLDFIVPQVWLNEFGLSTFNEIMESQPNVIKINHINIENQSFFTQSYLQAPLGYTIKPKRNFISLNAPFMDIDVFDPSGKKLSVLESVDVFKSLDFFLNKEDNEVFFENVSSWQDVMNGKLSLSTLGKSEVLFDRKKDQSDYIIINPVNRRKSNPKDLYFQLPLQVKEGVDFVFEQNPELANAIYESLGFSKEQESVSDIYSKLGSKTKKGNVVIQSVYQTAGVQYAKSIGGVFSLRLDNSEKHFGNPFSSVPAEIAKGLIATTSTKESVEKYIDWILNNDYNFDNPDNVFLLQMPAESKLDKDEEGRFYIKDKTILVKNKNIKTALKHELVHEFINTLSESEKQSLYKLSFNLSEEILKDKFFDKALGLKSRLESIQKYYRADEKAPQYAEEFIQIALGLRQDLLNVSEIIQNNYKKQYAEILKYIDIKRIDNKVNNVIKNNKIHTELKGYHEKYTIPYLIESERRNWIRTQLKSGELKNKPVIYYTELNEPSHATALDYLINDYNWNNQITPQQEQQAQQKYSDFLSNFVSNNFDNIIQDLQSKNIVEKKCN